MIMCQASRLNPTTNATTMEICAPRKQRPNKVVSTFTLNLNTHHLGNDIKEVAAGRDKRRPPPDDAAAADDLIPEQIM